MRGAARRSAIVLAVSGALVWGPAGMALAEGDLGIEADAVYELNPGESRLDVTVDFLITNQKPSTTSGYVTTSYYFDRFAVLLPDEAAAVVAHDGAGRTLDTTDAYEEIDEEGNEGRVLTITLPRRIFYRGTQRIVVSFVLPGGEPRSESMVRANPAYAAFAAWAWGDPGLSSVTIRIPPSFEVEYSGDHLRTSEADDFVTWSEDRVDEPEEWGVFFTARDDEALIDESMTIDGLAVTIRSWPGDPSWAERVADVVARGLPELKTLVGLDFGEQTTLDVIEALDPSLLGYGGWYLTEEDVIELSEDLDDHLVIHEIAHLWFNEDLFTERWINEGLADEFAAAVVAAGDFEADADFATVARPLANLSVAVPLNRWELPFSAPIEDDEVWRTEQYGYDASFWVLRSLRAEIGAPAMQAVLAAAAGDLTAYQDGTDPEAVDPTDGWRRFLDLLEEVGGSTEATALFEEFIVSTEDVPLLAERTAAREAYAALDAADGDWETPWAVRRSLGEWRFPIALAAIDAATDVVERRDEVAAVAGELGLTPPGELEAAYESAVDDAGLTSAATIGDAQLTAIEAVAVARASVDSSRSLMATIGLIGEDPETEYAQAATAFEEGRHEAAGTEAAEVVSLIDRADDVGTGRVLRTGGAVILLGGASVAAWILTKRRRARRAEIPQEG